MKTKDLHGAALDWAVAKCEFPEPDYEPDDWAVYITEGCSDDGWVFKPSTDWSQGGPIIEREGIDLKRITDSLWEAEINANDYHNRKNGPTPLIAAMRCYVASKLGEEIEVPEELMEVLR